MNSSTEDHQEAQLEKLGLDPKNRSKLQDLLWILQQLSAELPWAKGKKPSKVLKICFHLEVNPFVVGEKLKEQKWSNYYNSCCATIHAKYLTVKLNKENTKMYHFFFFLGTLHLIACIYLLVLYWRKVNEAKCGKHSLFTLVR